MVIMTAVLQRVASASVVSDGILTGEIGCGLVILLGVRKGDGDKDAELLAAKIPSCRIFCDENGKMNLSVADISGEVLVVSNFTLLADYRHGNRPDYMNAAPPAEADRLYEYFKRLLGEKIPVKSGVFGADMQISMTADGPVTIVMESDALKKRAQ